MGSGGDVVPTVVVISMRQAEVSVNRIDASSRPSDRGRGTVVQVGIIGLTGEGATGDDPDLGSRNSS